MHDDPILRRFRTALDALYGDRIERVVLFGARARRCPPKFRLRYGGVFEGYCIGGALGCRVAEPAHTADA